MMLKTEIKQRNFGRRKIFLSATGTITYEL